MIPLLGALWQRLSPARKLVDRFRRGSSAARSAGDQLLSAFWDEYDNAPSRSTAHLPVSANIEITNCCNLNCVMCNTKMAKRSTGFITPEVFEQALSELQSVGIRRISLHTVGETFLHPHLDELFSLIEKHGFSVWISTNAQFPDRIARLHGQYPRLFNQVRFSIDGATKETYEAIRRGASFEKALESFRVVREINRRTPQTPLDLSVDAVLSMSNIYELPTFFRTFAEYCSPDRIRFSLINGISPDPSFFRDTFPFQNLIVPYRPCYLPFRTVYVTYDGKVTLCCRDYDGDLIVGDLATKSLPEIWHGAEAEAVRAKHVGKEEMDIRQCRSCSGPLPSVSQLFDAYIRGLYLKQPGFDPHAFGEIVLGVLRKLDEAMGSGQRDQIKACIDEMAQVIG